MKRKNLIPSNDIYTYHQQALDMLDTEHPHYKEIESHLSLLKGWKGINNALLIKYKFGVFCYLRVGFGRCNVHVFKLKRYT